MRPRLLLFPALVAALAVAALVPAARSGERLAVRTERTSGVPAQTSGKAAKLDSRLAHRARSGGSGLVRVQLEARSGRARALRIAVEHAHGRVRGAYRGLVDALVPAAGLRSLAAGSDVRYIASPDRRVELGTVGEGVVATNASAWQAAGLDGAGVTVAVIDGGFQGFRQRQSEGDLPASLDTGGDFCAAGTFEGAQAAEHGTAVAESSTRWHRRRSCS